MDMDRAVYMATAVDKDMYKDMGMDVNMNLDTDAERERDMNTDIELIMDASQHPLA